MSKKYLNIMKNLKLDQIHACGELDINKWSQTNIRIDKKLIKKISKKYLNIMKNLKLDQIHASDELDINNWSLRDPNKDPN